MDFRPKIKKWNLFDSARSALPTPHILTSTSFVELGDTGSLNVRNVSGGVEFTINDGGKPVASLVLSPYRARWIIGALCKLCGVTEIRNSKPLGG